jgi:hypothetical protein
VWFFSRGDRGLARILRLSVASVMMLSALLASTGALARFDAAPPPMALLIVGVLMGSLALGLSPFGRESARVLPLVGLVGLQSFRLPLELVMHHCGQVGIMPPELSFSGYNFDILTGVGAVGLAGMMAMGKSVPRSLLWLWNLWGFVALAIIVVIAVTSSPMVRLFGDDPRHLNTWVLFFPYVWLPVVLVSMALSGHIIITRKLLLSQGS